MKSNHRSPHRALLLGGSILVIASLAACSSPDTKSPSSVPTVGAGATKTAETAVLPLDAYMNSLTGLSGSLADIQEQAYHKDLKREELIAACMQKDGFSYTPHAVKRTETTGQVGPQQSDLDSTAWVQKYGYGDVYTPEGATGAIDRAQEAAGSAKLSGATAAHDPNSQYRASLSAAERKAYDEALNGTEAANLSANVDWQKLGCSGEALHKVPNENVIMGSAQGKAVESAMESFYNGYSRWPGVAEAEKAWASCMADSGYAGYHAQSEPSLQFAGRNNALWASVNSDSQPTTTALDALAKAERTVALADLNCRQKTHYSGTLRAITIKQQNQFMADNKVALDALKATATQSGSK
ncbi:hypothetical protein [Parafrigoribacterium soli]|uniref:hypothetical protein n=1 Tax=Parafrigoribacterium soli TaxID=3144663 RepID=UPI0032F08F4E